MTNAKPIGLNIAYQVDRSRYIMFEKNVQKKTSEIILMEFPFFNLEYALAI